MANSDFTPKEISAEQLERETLSYLAGLVDADGYISIIWTDSDRRRFERPSPRFCEKIGLKQTTEIGPKMLKETFGGYLLLEPPQLPRGKQPLYNWSITGKKAGACAVRLLPFLRIKKRQARLLLRLTAHKTRNKTCRLTERGEDYRNSLRSRVRALNCTHEPMRK